MNVSDSQRPRPPQSAIRQSRKELKARGIDTTYAVARRGDNQYCILDANPIYGKYTFFLKPPLGPLHGLVYPDYQAALNRIVADCRNSELAAERSER